MRVRGRRHCSAGACLMSRARYMVCMLFRVIFRGRILTHIHTHACTVALEISGLALGVEISIPHSEPLPVHLFSRSLPYAFSCSPATWSLLSLLLSPLRDTDETCLGVRPFGGFFLLPRDLQEEAERRRVKSGQARGRPQRQRSCLHGLRFATRGQSAFS